jgi:ADP-heptose:LPS heptosyltransferase
MWWNVETETTRFIGPDVLPPGNWWCDRQTAGMLMAAGPVAKLAPVPVVPLDWANGNYNFKKILLGRAGGFGDLLMMTPIIRAIRRRWEKAEIHVAARLGFLQAMTGNKHLDLLVPFPNNKMEDYDVRISFADGIEHNMRGMIQHGVDCLAEVAGVPLEDGPGKYQLDLGFTPDEGKAIGLAMRTWDGWESGKVIGVQADASAVNRSWPNTPDLVTKLCAAGYNVAVFGDARTAARNKWQWHKKAWLSWEHKVSWKVSAGLVGQCRLMVAPDSSLFHVAGALNVPCIGVFGAFPFALRKTNECQVEAKSSSDCPPCGWHSGMAPDFPFHCPSAKWGVCERLSVVGVRQVFNMVAGRVEV